MASLTNSVDYSSFFSNNIDLINQNFSSLKTVLFLLILFIIIFSVFALIIFSLFKGLIWLKLRDKNFSWKFFRKYLLLNLIYIVPLTIILLFILLNIKNNVLLIIVLLIGVHFHLFLSYSLTDENKIKSSFKFAFTNGFKIKYFLVPYLIILIGLFILGSILVKLPLGSLKQLINLFIYAFYFAIIRNYINQVLHTINRK